MATLKLPRASDAAQHLLESYWRLLGPHWGRQARTAKARYCGTLIAVTGSCGKTTTTTLIGKLLAARQKVALGAGNNEERFVYRTLRHLRERVDVVVQEVSEYPLGTLDNVSRFVAPECVVVTSVGLDHVTSFRNEEGVAAEMVPIVQHAPLVVLNADDGHARGLAAHAGGRVVRFGTAGDADVRALDIMPAIAGRLHFTLAIGTARWPVQTRFVGMLMLHNVLGALATIFATGGDIDQAVATLAATEPVAGRCSFTPLPGHTGILLDSHKASAWTALRLVEDLPALGAPRIVFLLGPLSDTGNMGASKAYRRTMRAAAGVADLVIGYGPVAAAIDKMGSEKTKGEVIAAASFDEAIALCQQQPASLFVHKGNRQTGEGARLVRALGGISPFGRQTPA